MSRQASQRAFAGLSYGGFVAGTLLLRDTARFGYFGLFSPAPFAMPAVSKAQGAAIKHVGVMVGAGLDDGAYQWAASDIGSLRSAGDRVFVDPVYGGHDWFVWRALLHDFLTQAAFKPASPASPAGKSR